MSDTFAVKHRTVDIAFALALICALSLLIFLLPYGWSGADESFYIAEPYRFIQGDAYFTDDWSCGQLFSFVLIPLMRLDLALFGTTDGIILRFRAYYILFKTLAALAVYLRMRKSSPCGAALCSLMLLLYHPLTVRNLGYNSIGLTTLVLSCVLALTAERHKGADMLFSGLLLAVTVMCNPYAVALYVAYILFVAVLAVLKRFGKLSDSLCAYSYTVKAALWLTLGCALLLAAWLTFTFSRASLKDIIEAFPHIFGDPEHPPVSELWRLKNVIFCTITSSHAAKRLLLLYVALLAVMLADRRRIKHRSVYILLAALTAVLYCKPFVRDNIANELMLPLSFLGFAAYLLTQDKLKDIFRLLFVPGLLYGVCMHHSTSLRYLGLCSGLSLCSFASVFFIFHLLDELLSEQRTKHGIASMLLCAAIIASALLPPAQLILEGCSNVTHFFHDDSFALLDTKLSAGVQAGLITTAEHSDEYNAILADTEDIRRSDGEYVLYVSERGWLPLSDIKRSAAHTVWTDFDKPELSSEQLRLYLTLHPEKLPHYIYVSELFRYTYQPDVDGKKVVDIINIGNWVVERSSTGYIIDTSKTKVE